MANRRIQNRVIRALARDPYLDSFHLTVEAMGGVVFLGGTVDSYFEKVEAERVASQAAGVARVDNNIQVARGDDPLVYNPYVTDIYPYDYEWYDYRPRRSRLSDRTIEKEIEREMWWSPFVDGYQVNVEVENGIATLEGKVDTHRELNAAVESAYEGGAVWVDNELNVARSTARK
jgi:hyperosmotically inducible protein